MVSRPSSPDASDDVGFADSADMLPSDTNDDRQPSELEKTALLQKIKRWHREAHREQAEERKNIREAFGNYSGDQWDANDAAKLREDLRPVITFNRIAPTIDTVAGMEVNNRQEIHAYPREEGDGQLNETLTNAVEWVRDNCDAEDEESDAFTDCIIGGIGWTETRVDYEVDPDGMIVEERVDPLEMLYDPQASKRNLRDRRWQIHRKTISLERAQAMFPDREIWELDASWAKDDANDKDQPHDQTEAYYYRQDQGDNATRTPRRVTILHVQWYETEDFYRTVDPMTGQETKLDADKFDTVSKRIEEITGKPLPALRQKRRIYKKAMVGGVVLEVVDCPCKYDFTFQAITGKRDRNKKRWYGIVKAMIDPQKWANKFFSSILHNIATAGKGVMIEQDAVENSQDFENRWSGPDRIKWLKPGAVAAGKIMPIVPPPLPQGMADMMTFALGSLRDVSGVNLETLGQADREQPASLEWQRRKSAFSILAGYFDALRHYRKSQGRLLIYMIQEYISDGRLMRIEGQNGNPQYVPLNRDAKTVEYDVIVDDAPSSPDQKEATWMILQAMMPLLQRLPVPIDIWVEVIKQSPLPDSFAMKIAQILEQQKQQPPPPDPNMVKAQAVVEAQQAKTQLAAVQGQQKMQLDREKHQGDMELAQMKGQVDIAVQQAQAQSELEIERGRAQTEMAVNVAKAQQEAQLDRQRSEADMQIAREEHEHGMEISRAEFAEKKRQGAFKPKPTGGKK